MGNLLRFRLLMASRWAKENGFTLLVIAPLVIGGTGVIFQPYLEAAGAALRSGAGAFVAEHASAIAGVAAVALLLARLSGAIRDAFAVSEADHYLDALPVSRNALLHAVLITRFAKALPVALAIFFAIYLAAPREETIGALGARLSFPLVAVATALAVVETGAALAVVHLRLAGSLRLAALSVVAAAGAVALDAYAIWAGIAAVPIAYAVAAVGFARWRVEDRDVAREALARARHSSAAAERLATRWLGARVGSQVVRDLRLVRRGFSTEPYLAAALAVVLPALAVWLSRRYDLAAAQRAWAVEAATMLAAFSLGAVTHALVQYERERAWIDLVSGVGLDEFPRAKMWVARALAVPAFLAGCVAAVAAGVPLGVAEIVTLGWLAWSTATMTGVLSYEVKERPAAGFVLAFVAATGVNVFVVFYDFPSIFWYLGVFLYFYASWHLLQRAATRVTWEGEIRS